MVSANLTLGKNMCLPVKFCILNFHCSVTMAMYFFHISYNSVFFSHFINFQYICILLLNDRIICSVNCSQQFDFTSDTRLDSLLLFFRLFPSGIATADFPSPVVPIFCILLRHLNLSHALFHHIHKPPFWPSPFPLSWQLHPQHPSPNIAIIFPPYMTIPPQSCLSCFLSKPSHQW